MSIFRPRVVSENFGFENFFVENFEFEKFLTISGYKYYHIMSERFEKYKKMKKNGII